MQIDPNSVVLRQVKNSKTLNREFEAVLAIEKNKETILKFNKQQMRSGINSDGHFFTPYSEPYLRRKQKLASYKAPNGVPDLFLKGNMQNEMDMLVEGNRYDIFSTVSHFPFVQDRYPKAFDLSINYLIPARNIVTRDYNRNVHNHLNK